MKRKALLIALGQEIHALKNKMHFTKKAHKMPLTPAQTALLFLVASEGEGVSIKDLAAKLGVSSSAATQLVTPLCDDTYLDRKIDHKDRRAVRIVLAKRGIQLLKNMEKHRVRMLEKVFSPLTQDELIQFVTLVKKISDNTTL